jgi:hypothetical protein
VIRGGIPPDLDMSDCADRGMRCGQKKAAESE